MRCGVIVLLCWTRPYRSGEQLIVLRRGRLISILQATKNVEDSLLCAPPTSVWRVRRLGGGTTMC
jgi:hypothetical protein